MHLGNSLIFLLYLQCSLRVRKERRLLVPWAVEDEEVVSVVVDVGCVGDKLIIFIIFVWQCARKWQGIFCSFVCPFVLGCDLVSWA